MGFKDMIARCMARSRRGECATCESRDTCAFHRAGLFDAAPRPAANGLSVVLGTMIQRMIDRAAPANPFRRDVERRIEALLATGEVRIERVAADIGVSRQTLYRRLKDEGVTFEQLLDGVRHRLALRYVRADHLSVKAAAYRLGFSDPAAFSRAYKRWTGTSPTMSLA